MTAAEWSKSLIGAGLLIIVTAAIIYWVWPDWMAQRAVAGRLGSLLIMGGGGALMSLMGLYLATTHAR